MANIPDGKRLKSTDKTQDTRQDDAFKREVNRVGKLPEEDRKHEESYTEKQPTDEPGNEYGNAPLEQSSDDNVQFAKKVDKPTKREEPHNPRPTE